MLPLPDFINWGVRIVHAAVNSNTYAIYGRGDQKELTELVPGILNQLGPDSLASLRRMAEQYNAQTGGRGGLGAGKEKEPDDDDVPVSPECRGMRCKSGG